MTTRGRICIIRIRTRRCGGAIGRGAMMVGFFDVAVAPGLDKKSYFVRKSEHHLLCATAPSDTRHCGMRVFQRPQVRHRGRSAPRSHPSEVLVDLANLYHGWCIAAVIAGASICSPRAPHLMSKKRILVTDDHPSIRYLLRSLLETDEFTVCGEAANGGEAILKAAALAPDLILLDFAMPGMNGGETAGL